MLDALFRPFPPVAAGARLARRVGAAELLRLARLAVLPVRRYGEENFAGEGAPLRFAGNALHADLSPDAAGSAIYGWLLTMLGQTHGFPVPVGGAGKLTDALVRRLESKGGTVRLNAPVEQVLVSNGTATGVRLAGGEIAPAAQAVLADVTAPVLYGDLVGEHHLPARLAADLRNFQWDASTIKINWALGQMTTSDRTRSPEGTESVWASAVPASPHEAFAVAIQRASSLRQARVAVTKRSSPSSSR